MTKQIKKETFLFLIHHEEILQERVQEYQNGFYSATNENLSYDQVLGYVDRHIDILNDELQKNISDGFAIDVFQDAMENVDSRLVAEEIYKKIIKN